MSSAPTSAVRGRRADWHSRREEVVYPDPGLNADGIPSPSGHDPDRSAHRASGRGKRAKSAVRAYLSNPRYTGFEGWNKQRKDEVLIDVEDAALGHGTKMRW